MAKPITGRVSDRVGRVPVIVIGLLLCAAALPLIFRSESLTAFVLVGPLLGLGVGAVTPVSNALGSRHESGSIGHTPQLHFDRLRQHLQPVDREGRMKLAGDMLRAPMSLAKMSDEAATGTVIYRSKMHLGRKRNFQLMPGAEWLELLCKHIPDRYEHLVRYLGWYSNRAGESRLGAIDPQGV